MSGGEGMWDIDESGNIVWREGVSRSDLGGQRVGPFGFNIFPEGSPIGQEILRSRAVGQAPPPVPDWQMDDIEAGRDYMAAWERATGQPYLGDEMGYLRYRPYFDPNARFGAGGTSPYAPDALTATPDARGVDLTFAAGDGDGDGDSLTEALAALFGADEGPIGAGAGGAGGGYTPSFVDISAAEAMLPLTQTPEEEAALEQMLADLQRRGEEGIAAVRSGWEGVRAINQAAADKAQRMAIEAGPEAARLWIDAANNALTFARQTADAFTNIAGMQRVNISPTGGAQNIAALLAAQAPRARAFAERMGTVSAQDIASQARTAAMMGAAYVGEITRTVLQQAQEARAAHNQRVLDRIAGNRQTIAGLRASAATTNAQIANQAAQFAATQAAARARTPEQRVAAVETFYDLVDKFAVNPQGAALLINAYPDLTPAAANQILEAQRQGTLERMREEGLVEAEIRTAAGG